MKEHAMITVKTELSKTVREVVKASPKIAIHSLNKEYLIISGTAVDMFKVLINTTDDWLDYIGSRDEFSYLLQLVRASKQGGQ